VNKCQNKLGEEVPMWHLLRVACKTSLDSFFSSGTFLEASFKSDRPLFLTRFKVQNHILLGLKYKTQNIILLGLKYKVQNKFYTLYTIFTTRYLIILNSKISRVIFSSFELRPKSLFGGPNKPN